MTNTDFSAFLPLIVLLVWALAVLLLDLFIPHRWETRGFAAIACALGLIGALGCAIVQSGERRLLFNGMAVIDGLVSFSTILFLVCGLAGIALAYTYQRRMQIAHFEYYPLLLFSIGGMLLMAYANDLIIAFLALELLSIPLYILAGFARPQLESEEAALKYFLLGTFSSAFVLFGIALVFGATAHTAIPGIIVALAAGQANIPLFVLGSGFLLVGFSFKVGAVPFHSWVPDVYHGSPTSVSAFMAVGAKAAGFVALLRIFISAFPTLSHELTPVVWGIATLTMIVGNVLAIAQSNIKRLLAYSSIAHAGYLMMAFVPFANSAVVKDSVSAMLFYLVSYAITALGAWAVVITLEREEGKGLEIADLAGLGKKYPWLAIAMAVFMFSFSGLPPTLGFWGKFFLFKAVIEGGFLWLGVIGVVTSLISAAYYLRVVSVMFFNAGSPREFLVPQDRLALFTALLAAFLVLLLGIFPTLVLSWAQAATLYTF